MSYFKILYTFLLITISIQAFAQMNDDSLKRVLATSNNPKQKIKILTMLSDDYSESNIDSGLFFTNALYALAVKTKDRSAEGYAIGNRAYYYIHVGDLARSMKLTFASLQIFESIKDSINIANIYNGIGHIYRTEKDWKNAYKYYRMARALAVRIKDYRDDAFGSLNLAKLFMKDHHLDSAMIYAQRALYFREKYHLNYPESIVMEITADVYDAQGNYIKATQIHQRAMGTAIKQNDPALYSIQLEYADQLYKLHHIDSALIYADKVLTKKGMILLSEQATLYGLLSSIYKDKGEYKDAFEYQAKATTLLNSVNSIEQTQQTANLLFNEQQHQLDLKNAAIAAQEKMNEQLHLYLVISAAAVLMVVGLILWRNNRRQKHTNLQLSEQKEEIAAQRDNLSQALEELKNTQTQLVQREKMASLGELTAGIAHEIQNPLNFVNNFSEVNKEMLDELDEELDKGDIKEAKAIAADIRQNEEKINHHGKRADFIVKGMLLHSRNTTGEKEPTDINVMANEFLKLSYHGLRAKDKAFNAEMVTYFDKDLPKVNIAHQDIGRVLLNLFNNAFYAVNQKQKKAGTEYKPEVTVSTSAEKNNLIIKVKDNGNGIPDAIKDKIMQPFFTTKPTGEGTGLGLSLSYDIVVKGHGGSITVDTKEHEFTEFIVSLPIS